MLSLFYSIASFNVQIIKTPKRTYYETFDL